MHVGPFKCGLNNISFGGTVSPTWQSDVLESSNPEGQSEAPLSAQCSHCISNVISSEIAEILSTGSISQKKLSTDGDMAQAQSFVGNLWSRK